jgi:hypothetical protein
MVRSERLLVDREGTLEERLGVCIVALSTVQPGEVVEADGDGRMVRSERLLVDREGALVERLGVGIAALNTVQQGEVVETDGDGRMVRSEGLLADCEGALVGVCIVALNTVQQGEVGVLEFCRLDPAGAPLNVCVRSTTGLHGACVLTSCAKADVAKTIARSGSSLLASLYPAAANAATLSGATALHAPGRAIAPAFWLAAPGQGHASASPGRAPRPLLLSSWPYAPRAAPAVCLPSPSPRRRPFAPASVKGDALVIAKHGLAVDRRHFPAAKHAECVGKRPAHCRGDLAGDAHRQRAHVLMLDRKCERPFLAKHRELLACFLGAAISLDPIGRCHARCHAS